MVNRTLQIRARLLLLEIRFLRAWEAESEFCVFGIDRARVVLEYFGLIRLWFRG